MSIIKLLSAVPKRILSRIITSLILPVSPLLNKLSILTPFNTQNASEIHKRCSRICINANCEKPKIIPPSDKKKTGRSSLFGINI